MIKLRMVVSVALATLCAGVPGAYAGEWYRYQDDNGVLVMSHHVPAKFAHKGYTVVNDAGRVLRVVARQLTPDEIVLRDEELARQAEIEAQRQAVLDHDLKLMDLYATPAEVEFARDRKIAAMDTEINTLKGEIQRLRSKQRLYETQAAEKERGQMPVSREILHGLETVQHEIADKQGDIEARQREQNETREEFALDLDRIYELYGLSRPVASN